jgi:UDP-2-acetamido-2,6-beta-L-arabino-hexul-4-ose reductase
MRIAVTGSNGFLGWHLKCANKALYNHELVDVSPPHTFEGRKLSDFKAVIHLASKMRGSEIEIAESNRKLTNQLLASLEGQPPGIFVHANSIHSGNGSAFGQSKAEMSQKISQKCQELGWRYFDVKFPNIFGERAKPFHNSFIATVITSLHENKAYEVLDNQISLISAHEAAKYLLDLCTNESVKDFESEATTVGEVVKILELFHATYRNDVVPELENLFKLKLFNAYRFNL